MLWLYVICIDYVCFDVVVRNCGAKCTIVSGLIALLQYDLKIPQLKVPFPHKNSYIVRNAESNEV